MEQDTSTNGTLIGDFPEEMEDFIDCEELCRESEICLRFTYKNNKCYLFESYTDIFVEKDSISGKKIFFYIVCDSIKVIL